MTRKCQQCSQVLPTSARFCRRCGKSVHPAHPTFTPARRPVWRVVLPVMFFVVVAAIFLMTMFMHVSSETPQENSVRAWPAAQQIRVR